MNMTRTSGRPPIPLVHGAPLVDGNGTGPYDEVLIVGLFLDGSIVGDDSNVVENAEAVRLVEAFGGNAIVYAYSVTTTTPGIATSHFFGIVDAFATRLHALERLNIIVMTTNKDTHAFLRDGFAARPYLERDNVNKILIYQGPK